MTIMPKQSEADNTIYQCCQHFIQRFHINRLLREANATKEKGIPAYDIFAFLLGMIFSGKNLYTLIATCQEKVGFGKDAVYRFLNKSTTNWTVLLRKLACSVIQEVKKLTSDDRKTALIIDDSPYYRNRSKKVELLSRCYDHVKGQYYKGLTLLTLGWSDGQTFLPVDFRLVASNKDKHLLHGSNVKSDRRTLATKRRNDARKEKPALVLEMLESVKGTQLQAKYVLFDSWFASPSSILSINALEYHVVARLKNHEKYLYSYQDKNLSISAIYGMNKKRRGKSRYLLSVIVEVRHNNFSKTIPAKLVYIRSKSNRKKWITLISTDTSLTEEEVIALYGKRWDIETFFKVIKSNLRLAKEFQTRSFDAMTAHTSIVFIRYTLLSLENRESKDERTIGALFFTMCNELEDISFACAFELLINTLKHYLNDHSHLPMADINSMVEQFIAGLPLYLKAKLSLPTCES